MNIVVIEIVAFKKAVINKNSCLTEEDKSRPYDQSQAFVSIKQKIHSLLRC